MREAGCRSFVQWGRRVGLEVLFVVGIVVAEGQWRRWSGDGIGHEGHGKHGKRHRGRRLWWKRKN